MGRAGTEAKTTGLAGIILAAGASTRLGQPKQLLRLDGRPLITRAVEAALPVCGAGVLVVTGAYHDDVMSALNGMPVSLVHNDAWEEGIGASIRGAVTAIKQSVDAILVLLGDQPAVDCKCLKTLAAKWAADPGHIAASRYDETVGVPAIFPRQYWPLLAALSGDKGAKSIIDAAESVNLVAMPEAALDIDTPEDLEALLGREE